MGIVDELRDRRGSSSNKRSNVKGVKDIVSKLRESNPTRSYDSIYDDYINRFYKDAQAYFDSAQSKYDNINYENANTYKNWSKHNGYNDLRKRADYIRAYANANKETLGKDYDSLIASLDDFENSGKTITSSFDEAVKYFTQFETKQDYLDYEADQKQREEMLSTDLGGIKTQIADLKNTKGNIEDLNRELIAIKSKYQVEANSMNLDPEAAEKYVNDRVNSDKEAKELQDKIDSYGGIVGVGDKLSERTRYYNTAKRLQEWQKLTDDAVNAEDFALYSERGANIENPSTSEAERRFSAKKPGNIVTYSRDNLDYFYTNKNDNMTPVSNWDAREIYRLMSDDEVNIYNYYLAKYGEEKAQAYVDTLEDTLQARQGQQMYEGMEDHTALELAFSMAAGLDQFVSGTQNLFSNEDYIPTSAIQYASGMVREDLADADNVNIFGNSLSQSIYDFGTTTFNMMPSILTSALVGAVNPIAGSITGSALMGASASGNAYAEMLNLGYDKGQARSYSALVGASEAGLQLVLGGISKLGGAMSGNAISNAVKGIDNAFARAAIKYGGNMLSEGLEESLQDVLDPFFKNLAFNETSNKVDWSSVAYSGLLGALSAGVLEGPSTIANTAQNVKAAKALKAEGQVDKLKAIGNTFAADTVAYKIAQKVDENTGAYTLATLIEEVNGTLTEQNQTDIKNALMENYIAPEHAETISKWLAKAVDGATLTKAQQKALEENEVISKVFGDVIINRNSTVNQRRAGLMEMGVMESGYAGVDTEALAQSQTPENITMKIALNVAMERALAEGDKQARFNKNITDKTLGPITATAEKVNNSMRTSRLSDSLQNEADTFATEYNSAKKSLVGESNFRDVGQFDEARKEAALKQIGKTTVADVDGLVEIYGKTIRKSTGEEVSIKKVDSIDTKNKTMILELEDGTKVDSKDISYKDRNQALLYESALILGYDAHTANAIIQGYDANSPVSAEDYLKGTREAFNYGWGHISEKARTGEAYKKLTKSQREHAVKIGEDARAADDKQRKANMPNKQNAIANKNKTYGATLEAGKDYVHGRVNASVEALDVFGKKLNLHFTIKDLEGTSNGYYDPSTDEIVIDINAGRNGQHTLLWTASHELVHRLREWNPDKFTAMADFLMERYAKEGKDIDELIRIEQAKAIKASKGKTTLTYDEAYEEVVCQAMQGFLTDSNFITELNELQKKDATLAEKLISFLKDILDKIRNAYKGLSPSDKATAYLKEMGDTADKLYKMLSEGLMETADTVTKGDANAAITLESDGTIKAQLKQYDDTGRDALYNYMKDNYSEKEADELIETVDLIANTVRDLKNDKSLSVFGNWQEQEVELDEEGHPIFTTNITNGDYSLNQDFSRVCKKRRQLDFVLNMLAEDPAFEASNLTKEDFVAINNAIKEHGFEIACALCFVDAKRFRQAEWADSYANTYNDILQSVTKQKLTPFNFATKNPNMADDNIEIDLNAPVSFRKWSDGKVTSTRKYKNLNELIAKEGNNQVKAIARMIKNNPNYRHLFRGADIVASQGFDSIQRLAPDIRQTLDGWGGTSVPKPSSSDAIYDNSILNIAGYNADSAFAVGGVRMNSFSDFMGHMFFDYVQAFADLTAKKLPMQSYTKELDFARLFGLTGGKINMSLIAKIREGALSLDGLSETSTKYKNIKAAEQRVAGLDITKLTERLGKSVMELTDEDILNNLDLVDYLWADESIDYKKAVLLQSGILYDNLTDEQIDKCVDLIRKKEIKQAHKVAGTENVDTRYAKNIGTICVGVSDAHILKLLRDDTIRMVIPYHKSGLNGAIAKALNIAYYVDYSSSQTTGLCILQDDGTYASRIGLNGASAAEKGYKIKDFSFYDYFGKTIDGVTYDAKKTAAKYKEWCEFGVYDEEAGCNVYYLKSGGYITAEELHKTAKIVPKFEQFSNEENYYKVLEDFDCYDTLTGEHSQQNAVEMNLPSDYKSVLKSSLGAEQQVSDDFKHHLDHEGLRDEIMNIVKKNGYVPSEGVKHQYAEGEMFEEDKYYARQIDKWESLKVGSVITVGMIKENSPLNRIGMTSGKLYFDVSKIKESMGDHNDHLSETVLKDIPKLLNNPIVIVEYNVGKNTNTANVYGELYYHGTPITVGIVATLSRGKTVISKVRTVHARSNFAKQITDASVLFLGENKKETNAWFQAQGQLSVPMGGAKYGFIRSIYDAPPNVNTNQEISDTDDMQDRKHQYKDSDGNELSAEQQEFFKDSKVRDENGNLLIVYHGTPDGGFTEFKLPEYLSTLMNAYGSGYYFTDKKNAEQYTKSINKSVRSGAKSQLYKVYLNITNPLEIKWDTKQISKDSFKDIIRRGNREWFRTNWMPFYADGSKSENQKLDFESLLEKYTDKVYRQSMHDGDILSDLTRAFNGGNDVILNAMKDVLGNDGVRFSDNYGDIWVAWSSEQIKNTDNKAPTSNPDIRYQYKDEDSLDSRNLLANALITTAKVGEERNLLRNYQSKINLINAEEQKLTAIRKKLFTKNAVDSEERKKLQHEAKAIATRINKYDKELLKLESMAPMKKVLQKEKDLATKRQKQKDAEAMREYKETMENKQREISQRWMENRSKAVESRNKTELRHKIRKTVKELDTVLRNGRKKRNVKVGLRSAVEQAISTAEVLFSPMSNEDIYNAGPITAVTAKEKSMLAEYGELIQKASSLKDKMESLKTQEGTWNEYLQLDTELEQINESIKKLNRDLKDVFTRERNRLQESPISDAIQQLADAYKEVSQSKEKHIGEAYDDIVYQMLITMKEKLGGATIYDMSPEQLRMVYDAYRLILHTVSTSNKLFRESKLEELSTNAENVMSEVKAIKKSKDERIAIFDEANTATWNELKPIYAFDRIGSETLSKLYKDLRKGQDSWGRDIDEAAQFIEKIRNKYDYNSWNIKERYAVELVTGKKVELTLPQMMSIYAYSKRDQAKDHMEKGGFVFNNKETFKKEKKLLKYIATQSEAFRIGEEDVANIKEIIGEKAVNYVNEMQAYLSDVMAAKGNEVSKQLFGIELFKEAIYFPLKSAKDFIFEANTPAGEIALKNAGMTKETTPHASNPIVLENFDDVWANHVNKMSLYHSLVVPIDNMNKVFNYTDYALSDDSNSVQSTLRGAYGNGVNEYIQKLLQDINGGITSDKVKSPLAGLVGTFKKTAVAASLSVVVQQPTAVVRAMSMVDLKYFIPDKSLKHSEKWEQLKKYAPVAVIKEIGGFDAGSGRQAAQYLTATEYKGLKQKAKAMFTDSNFRDEVFMSGAGFADELGWNLIWDACKREVKATTNLKGEELLKKAGERFTEVVDYTQVYDSSLSRSGYMRSQSDIVKMATSFMGEPTTSFNMIYNTLLQAKRKNISGWKAARTVGATVASIVLGAAFKSAIGAGRDDDEDESYTEKYFQALGSNLSSDIWIWNWLPFVKDIVSIFEGWDIERTDMALVADLKQAIDGFSSDSKSTWKKYEDLIGTIGNFFGVPVKNILRDGRSMVNIFKGIFDDIKPQNARESLREGWTGKETTIISSLDSNNTERAKELIDDKIAGYIADGKTEKEAKSYVRSSLTSEYKERYLEAYAKKDNDELIRIRKLLHSTGVYDNVVETCQNWVKDSKK